VTNNIFQTRSCIGRFFRVSSPVSRGRRKRTVEVEQIANTASLTSTVRFGFRASSNNSSFQRILFFGQICFPLKPFTVVPHILVRVVPVVGDSHFSVGVEPAVAVAVRVSLFAGTSGTSDRSEPLSDALAAVGIIFCGSFSATTISSSFPSSLSKFDDQAEGADAEGQEDADDNGRSDPRLLRVVQ
jgi:hypothetical protein